jgi:hypothetical protein
MEALRQHQAKLFHAEDEHRHLKKRTESLSAMPAQLEKTKLIWVHPKGWGRGGFTLVELSMAIVVSIGVSLFVMLGFIQGSRYMRANETEMWARERGSRVIRRIYTDLMRASAVHIFTDYTNVTGAETTYGSCAVLDIPATSTTAAYSVAYYLAGGSNTDGSGSILYDNSVTIPSPPNPNGDKLYENNVLDLEFRRIGTGPVRVGFEVGFIGYPRRVFGSIEQDRVRFSTSVTSRNQ